MMIVLTEVFVIIVNTQLINSTCHAMNTCARITTPIVPNCMNQTTKKCTMMTINNNKMTMTTNIMEHGNTRTETIMGATNITNMTTQNKQNKMNYTNSLNVLNTSTNTISNTLLVLIVHLITTQSPLVYSRMKTALNILVKLFLCLRFSDMDMTKNHFSIYLMNAFLVMEHNNLMKKKSDTVKCTWDKECTEIISKHLMQSLTILLPCAQLFLNVVRNATYI